MRGFAVALVVVLLQASPADALSCQRWSRLDAYRKADTIDRMIASAVRSNEARRYSVDVDAIGRCLEGNTLRMEQEFDSACGDSRRAGMGAIDGIFKNYIWSCVR